MNLKNIFRMFGRNKLPAGAVVMDDMGTPSSERPSLPASDLNTHLFIWGDTGERSLGRWKAIIRFRGYERGPVRTWLAGRDDFTPALPTKATQFDMPKLPVEPPAKALIMDGMGQLAREVPSCGFVMDGMGTLARGWLTKKDYAFAPDANRAPLEALTMADVGSVTWGETGMGMTNNAMRPIAKRWLQKAAHKERWSK